MTEQRVSQLIAEAMRARDYLARLAKSVDRGRRHRERLLDLAFDHWARLDVALGHDYPGESGFPNPPERLRADEA
jgi:hypothetical protein